MKLFQCKFQKHIDTDHHIDTNSSFRFLRESFEEAKMSSVFDSVDYESVVEAEAVIEKSYKTL